MSLKKKFTRYILIGLTPAVFACSHSPTVQEFPNTANPNAEVSKLESDVKSAFENQVDVLSPSHFSDAESALNDAKESLDKKRDSQDVLHSVAVGRSHLSSANEFAQIAHTTIEDVIIARRQALTAGANQYYLNDLKSIDKDLKKVTSDIEKNRTENATQNRSALQLKYLDLELRSIKQAKLGKSRETIVLALKEGAKNLAPQSLAIAEKSVQDTDSFITANRHEEGQIAQRSEDTRKSSEHLLKITRDAKSGKKTSSEETALRMESEQNKVALTQQQLAEGANANAALNAENANLESKQAFNQRFEAAQNEFTDSEAEVYKQGNSLLIRLKTLEFPVNQAVLKGSNFPVLVKVEKVIQSFGKSSVVVEGHTDSQGGKKLNKNLSTKRAEAVRDYLVSNSEGKPVSISAIGYGYEKPLAPNKTSKGRAQNRRVDILIQPDAS